MGELKRRIIEAMEPKEEPLTDRNERTMLYCVSFYVGIDALRNITDRIISWWG